MLSLARRKSQFLDLLRKMSDNVRVFRMRWGSRMISILARKVNESYVIESVDGFPAYIFPGSVERIAMIHLNKVG